MPVKTENAETLETVEDLYEVLDELVELGLIEAQFDANKGIVRFCVNPNELVRAILTERNAPARPARRGLKADV